MTNLLFAAGNIAGRYQKLMNEQDLASFKEVSSKQAFLSLLENFNYGLNNRSDLEVIMLEEEIKHKNYLKSIVDENHLIFDLLYINFNQLFLANLLKSYHLGVSYKNEEYNLSNYDEPLFYEYVIHGVDKGLSFDDKAFIDYLILNTKDLDAQALSDFIIKDLNDRIVKKLSKNKYPEIKLYYDYITTNQNTLLLIRAKRYLKTKAYLEANLLDGGHLSKHLLIDLLDKSWSEIGETLALLYYGTQITECFKDINSSDFMKQVSTVLDISLSNKLIDLTFSNYNFGSIIDFTLKVRGEIINLKEIYYDLMED